MRKSVPHKFIYHITREDKAMLMVKHEVSEEYINKILAGKREPKGEQAAKLVAAIKADIELVAEANRQHDTYKRILLEADELGYEEVVVEDTPPLEVPKDIPDVPAWGATLTNQTAA